jgi:hypothetical protein
MKCSSSSLSKARQVPTAPLLGNNVDRVGSMRYSCDLGRLSTGVFIPVAKRGQQGLAILPLGSLLSRLGD